MRPVCSCSAQAMAADVKRSNAIAIAQVSDSASTADSTRPRCRTEDRQTLQCSPAKAVLRIAYVSAAAETNMKPCSVHRRHRPVYCGPRLPNQCVSAEAEAKARD